MGQCFLRNQLPEPHALYLTDSLQSRYFIGLDLQLLAHRVLVLGTGRDSALERQAGVGGKPHLDSASPRSCGTQDKLPNFSVPQLLPQSS